MKGAWHDASPTKTSKTLLQMNNGNLFKVLLVSLMLFMVGSEMAYSQIQTPNTNRSNGGSTWGNSNSDLRGGNGSGKWFWGGNLGASIGNTTYIDISPLVGYRISEEFSIGTGLIFNYIAGNGQSLTLYGARTLARYQVFNDLFLQTEFELLRGSSGGVSSEWQSRLPVGGGWRTRMGGNSYFTIEVLYDLLYDDAESIYPSPLIVRAGGTIGF